MAVSVENSIIRLAFMNKMQDIGHIMRLAVEILNEEFQGNTTFWSSAVSKAFFLKNSNFMEGEVWDANVIRDFQKSMKSEYKTLLSNLKDQMKSRNERLYGLSNYMLIGQALDPVSDDDIDFPLMMSHTAHEIIVDFNTFLDSLETLPKEYFDEQIQSKLAELSQRLSSTFPGQNGPVKKNVKDGNITVAEKIIKSKIFATDNTSKPNSKEAKEIISANSTKNNVVNGVKPSTENVIIPGEVSRDEKFTISGKYSATKKQNEPKRSIDLAKESTPSIASNSLRGNLNSSENNGTNVESRLPKKVVSATEKFCFKSPVNYQQESTNAGGNHSNIASQLPPKDNKISPLMHLKIGNKTKLDNSKTLDKSIEKEVSSEMTNVAEHKDAMKDVYMTDLGNNQFFCCLCNIQLKSVTNALQHLSSSKHRFTVPPGKEYEQDRKKVKENAPATTGTSVGDEINKYIMIENAKRHCKLCNVPLSSYGNAVQHISGNKHKEMLKKGSSSEPDKLGKNQMQRLSCIVQRDYNQYYCQLCKITVSGNFTNVMQHLDGFYHKSYEKIKRQKSLGNHMENLILNGNEQVEESENPNSYGIVRCANDEFYCMYCKSQISNETRMLEHITRSGHNKNKFNELKKL